MVVCTALTTLWALAVGAVGAVVAVEVVAGGTGVQSSTTADVLPFAFGAAASLAVAAGWWTALVMTGGRKKSAGYKLARIMVLLTFGLSFWGLFVAYRGFKRFNAAGDEAKLAEGTEAETDDTEGQQAA